MDFKAIEQLIQAIDQSNLTSVEIEEEGLKIVLKKEKEKVIVQPSVESVQPMTIPTIPIQRKEATRDEDLKEKETDQLDEGLFIVKSPIVGTFYEASSPDADPFVKVGDTVKKGDVLCIVEAMKLMNEIESEVDGTIVEIMIDNEQMVEYHQPIMKIRK